MYVCMYVCGTVGALIGSETGAGTSAVGAAEGFLLTGALDGTFDDTAAAATIFSDLTTWYDVIWHDMYTLMSGAHDMYVCMYVCM